MGAGAADSLSTAIAASSDSRLATSITVNTAVARASTGPCGTSGRTCERQDGRSTRAMPGAASEATVVAVTTATRAAGTRRAPLPIRPGIRGHRTRTAMVSAPMSGAAGLNRPNWSGRASALATAELCGEPPSTMCSWASAMATPVPARVPWTMAGLTARALRAARSEPSRI